MTRILLAFALLFASLSVIHADEPEVLDVFPAGKVPGEPSGIEAEKEEKGKDNIIRVGNVTRPTLTIYRAPKSLNNGTMVVIAPGGGYHILAWDLEGTEVAQWLNSLGVNAAVLKYRVPRRPGTGKEEPLAAFQDAQRAISLVRSKADDLRINPDRVGMLGFSAGGHLTARTANGFQKRSYDSIDAADEASPRPDFTILIYPAYLVNEDATKLRDDLLVTKDTPPSFIAYAFDDPVKPENSAYYWLALKRANVPSELHIYSRGGHGFGLRPSPNVVHTWPARCAEWMKAQNLLPVVEKD